MSHKTTYAEYLNLVVRAIEENPRWRRGQAAFNVLYELRPDLSERVRATPLDPFHQDTVAYWDWVEAHWEDKP